MLQDRLISLLSKFDFPLWRLPGLLMKGVQHVNPFCKLGDVKDPMLLTGMDSQLIDTGRYTGHGFEIVGLETLLNQVELMTSDTSSVFGKGSQIVKGRANPEDLFLGRAHYTSSCM